MNYEKLSPSFQTDFPEEWYDMNQGGHFWFAWRLRVLKQLLQDAGLPMTPQFRALEIGCGIGFLRTQIESITPWTVDGADLNEPALQKASPSRGRTLLYNIEDRQDVFREQYDGIVLFDVLEHINDAPLFLKAALWHLKPGGWVIVNVPALSGLYSKYDELVGHFRRYNVESMRRLLQSQDLEPLEFRYWGFSLVPVAWLRKTVVRKSRTPQEAIAIGFHSQAEWINALFKVAMRLETSLLKHPPAGSSLMVLAVKRNDQRT